MTNANYKKIIREIRRRLATLSAEVRYCLFFFSILSIFSVNLHTLFIDLYSSEVYPGDAMTTKAESSYFEYYFLIAYPDLYYDVLSARFMFLSGVRPEEFLNLSTSNLDLTTNTLNFTQAKGGLYTTRAIDETVINQVYELWRLYGAPNNFYGSYSSLSNYIRRTITPKFTVTNRNKGLYPFRYSCAGDLLRQGFTTTEIEVFFNHNNTANTTYYIQQGENINLQLSTL